MPDVFISYSSQDSQLATFAKNELDRHGVSTFAACATLQPGDHWSSSILSNLRASRWIVVLVSKHAAQSAYVNQEIGAALADAKTLVPIILDIDPSALPGWLSKVQGIDLRGKTIAELQSEIGAVAARVHEEKQ